MRTVGANDRRAACAATHLPTCDGYYLCKQRSRASVCHAARVSAPSPSHLDERVVRDLVRHNAVLAHPPQRQLGAPHVARPHARLEQRVDGGGVGLHALLAQLVAPAARQTTGRQGRRLGSERGQEHTHGAARHARFFFPHCRQICGSVHPRRPGTYDSSRTATGAASQPAHPSPPTRPPPPRELQRNVARQRVEEQIDGGRVARLPRPRVPHVGKCLARLVRPAQRPQRHDDGTPHRPRGDAPRRPRLARVRQQRAHTLQAAALRRRGDGRCHHLGAGGHHGKHLQRCPGVDLFYQRQHQPLAADREGHDVPAARERVGCCPQAAAMLGYEAGSVCAAAATSTCTCTSTSTCTQLPRLPGWHRTSRNSTRASLLLPVPQPAAAHRAAAHLSSSSSRHLLVAAHSSASRCAATMGRPASSSWLIECCNAAWLSRGRGRSRRAADAAASPLLTVLSPSPPLLCMAAMGARNAGAAPATAAGRVQQRVRRGAPGGSGGGERAAAAAASSRSPARAPAGMRMHAVAGMEQLCGGGRLTGRQTRAWRLRAEAQAAAEPSLRESRVWGARVKLNKWREQ